MDPTTQRRKPGRLADLSPSLTPSRAALAEELRRGRKMADLSLAQLAHRTYSSKASVSRWLNGQSLPSQDQAARWAQACGTDPVVMGRLQAAASATSPPDRAEQRPEAHLSGLPDAGPKGSARSAVFTRRTTVIVVTAVIMTVVGVVSVLLVHRGHPAACPTRYAMQLEIPPETGPHVAVSVEATCPVPTGHAYRIVEEVLDVDPSNPHPAYYIKASVPYLKPGHVSTARLVLGEPLGTRAVFFVIGVDNAGLRALKQNQITDHGLLFLPSGTLRVSRPEPHRRIW